MKYFCLCFVSLLIIHSSFSQSKKLEIGIVAGPSLSFLFGNEILRSYTKPILRYAFGGSLDYHFTDKLAFAANIIYERKGNSYLTQMTDAMGNPIYLATTYAYYDYLSIPVLLKPSFGNKLKFFLTLGPNFNFLLNTSTEISSSSQQNMNPYFNLFDLGLTTGIGITAPLSDKFNFSVELRNNLGLLNISKVPVYGNGTIQINSTNLLIGVSYKL